MQMAHQGQDPLAPEREHTENFMFSDGKQALQGAYSAARSWKVGVMLAFRWMEPALRGPRRSSRGTQTALPKPGARAPHPAPNAAHSARPAASLQSACSGSPPLVPRPPTVTGHMTPGDPPSPSPGRPSWPGPRSVPLCRPSPPPWCRVWSLRGLGPPPPSLPLSLLGCPSAQEALPPGTRGVCPRRSPSFAPPSLGVTRPPRFMACPRCDTPHPLPASTGAGTQLGAPHIP